MDSSWTVAVIKDTMIDHGLRFLPRNLTDLPKNLQTWLEELVDTGNSEVPAKVVAVLEELLQSKGISQGRYTTIKEDNNIR